MNTDSPGRLSWWKNIFALADKIDTWEFSYRGETPSLQPGLSAELWLAPALLPPGSTPAGKAVCYSQCQFDIPRSGGVECVTTSAVIARNLVKDQIAAQTGLPKLPDLSVVDFTNASNRAGMAEWKYRLPSSLSLVGGFMHPTLQLPKVLDRFAVELQDQYPLTFSHEFSSYNTPQDLIDNLRDGRVTLIHGVWEGLYVNPANGSFKFDIAIPLGGFPHTMPLVMYSAGTDQWWFYHLGWRHTDPGDGFYKMSTKDLVKFWGRHYIFNTYTRPFSMTTLTVQAPPAPGP